MGFWWDWIRQCSWITWVQGKTSVFKELTWFSLNSFAQENNSSDEDPNFAQFQKGVEAVKSKDYALAADIFEELAVSGDMDAQFNYAILVRNGLGRAQNYSEALYWTWLSYASGLEKADKVLEKILSSTFLNLG